MSTHGNVNDFVPYIGRLKVQKEKFDFKIEEVVADTGYDFLKVHCEDLAKKLHKKLNFLCLRY